ncbi:MAG: TadG family pilus assembly protein [Rhizobiaceae bacterium]
MGSKRTQIGKGFLRSHTGNLATLTALLSPAMLLLAAFAVDEGSLYVEQREAQGLTDLAAITAAAHIDNAENAAGQTFFDNGYRALTVDGEYRENPDRPTGQSGQLAVEQGRYSADASLPVGERFLSGGTPYNAVRVSFSKVGTTWFGQSLLPSPKISVSAVAGSSSEAAFSLGSRLASLNGGIENALLGALLGTQLSLSAMDYNALLSANVDALDFTDALATQLHVNAGTYDTVLQSKATVGQIAAALASVKGLDTDAKAALDKIAAASLDAMLPMKDLINLGPLAQLALGDSSGDLHPALSVMELLTAGAALASGGHQVAVDLGATVPGLLKTTLLVTIGEPPQHSPWFSVGETGAIVRTAQTRLSLAIDLSGAGALPGIDIRIPLYLEIAYAEAKLTSIDCSSGSALASGVTIDAKPGVVEAWIGAISPGDMADFSRSVDVAPATLVKLPLVSISALAHAAMTNNDPTQLRYDATDIRDHAVKTVSTRDFTSSLFGSLLGNLQLNVNVVGLGLGVPPGLTTALNSTLQAIAPTVDGLLYNLLGALGVKLGQADVQVTGAVCGRAVLVQ